MGVSMKKSLGLFDIVLMNVTAIIGLRSITLAAGYGASSIFLWFFVAFMFFILLGLVQYYCHSSRRRIS